jgi:hypothetical protein
MTKDPEGVNLFTIDLGSINARFLPLEQHHSNDTYIEINSTQTKFVIDPVTPYMWLPVETMSRLERVMGLQYDAKSQLYLLPSTPVQVPNLYFGIANGSYSSPTYRPSSGDGPTVGSQSKSYLLTPQTLLLNASFPLYNGTADGTDSRRYLPFKQGPYPSTGAYTLGRAFFQSIHIIANYEIGSFSIAQAKYDPAEGRLPTGLSHDSLGPTVPTTLGGSPYPYSDSGSGELAVILIAVLCTVGGLAVCISIYGCCAYRKAKWPFRRRRNQDEDGDILRTAKAELDGTASAASSGNGLSLSSTETSVVLEMQGSSIPVEMRGSPIAKAELDGDMPYYELDARPRSIDWGNKDADPSVIVMRLLARQ